MTIGSSRKWASFRQGHSNDLRAYLPSPGNFCWKINYARYGINHISVAAGDNALADLELMIYVSHTSGIAQKVPFSHHGPDNRGQVAASTYLLVEEDLKAAGCSLCQQIEDLAKRAGGELAGFIPAKISSRVSDEAVIAKIDGKASHKALSCDYDIVAVHKYRSSA